MGAGGGLNYLLFLFILLRGRSTLDRGRSTLDGMRD